MPKPRRPRSHRSRRQERAAEHWLLLLGTVFVVAAIASLVDPSRWWHGIAPSRPARHLTMAEARRSNAAVPIETDKAVPARPFVFHGGPAAREQATDCLATAALYEVGNDLREQRAIIQVVLNRVRHPGYPKTVCGVVYQGVGRTTGCQFSFVCDGSLARRPEHWGWAAARRSARQALAGHVFADIGAATNYHANWIVPYWRDSLVKVARVRTHLFYTTK